ncbi:hypothetical protein, partial [Pedobacter steynii]
LLNTCIYPNLVHRSSFRNIVETILLQYGNDEVYSYHQHYYLQNQFSIRNLIIADIPLYDKAT